MSPNESIEHKHINPKGCRIIILNTQLCSPGLGKGRPLIIRAQIKKHYNPQIYVDGESVIDIMFEHYFRQLPSKLREGLEPSPDRLTGFSGHSVTPLGAIFLPFTLEYKNSARRKMVILHFIIVWAASKHHITLGRKTMLKFGAVATTVHGLIKFPTGAGMRPSGPS